MAGALIGMHAFTGCDTVSAFAGRGKVGSFKQKKSDRTYQEAFLELGRAWCLNNGLKCTNLCKLQTCANLKAKPDHPTVADVPDIRVPL